MVPKMSRTGTSCSNIANLGNLESGTYLLDIDGKKNEAPFEVKTFIQIFNLPYSRHYKPRYLVKNILLHKKSKNLTFSLVSEGAANSQERLVVARVH